MTDGERALDGGSEDRPVTRRRKLSITTERGRNGDVDEVTAKDDVGVPLSPAARLFHQPRFNCSIIAMMGFGTALDVDVVKDGLEATLVRHPRFSSVMVDGESKWRKPKWVQTKVVIDEHIIVPNLHPPPNSPTTSNEKLIEDYVASLSQTKLDLSRPLWDIHLLNLPTAEAQAVAVLRIHHSLGDGISLMSLLLACTRKTSQPDTLPSLPRSQRHPYKHGSRTVVIWLWAMLVTAWHTVVGVVLFLATAAFLKDSKTPLMGEEGVEFHPKRFVHRNLGLDDLKAIKNEVGCTINDVLVGLTSAALSRYLNRRYGEDSNGKKKKKNLPAHIRLRSTILVNIRPTPGIHALAKMMEGGGGARWGNWLGYIILPFHIMTCEDPLDYVRKGMKVAERKKNSFEAIFTYTSGTLLVKLFGIKVAAALCHRMLRHTTVSFSNIVGPVEEIGFYGHPIVYLAPSVYGHPQAVTLHFQSYMDKMKIVLAVDELTVPDPNQLLDDLIDSLELIKDAIVTKSS